MSKMLFRKLFLRNEIFNNEYRAPIIPSHVKILIDYGYIVYIQSSSNRCYDDFDYIKYGAVLVFDDWYNYNNDCLIIGIKELNFLDKLNNHNHLYFSHSFKNQFNSNYILQSFKKSNSILFDFEYFINTYGKRIIAFGFFAGIVGTALGIMQFYNKTNNIDDINNLTYWNSIQNVIKSVNHKIISNINIAIVGPNGNSGSGVKFILDQLHIKYHQYTTDMDKSTLINYDIVFNCINLTSCIPVWFDNNTIFRKNIVIVDISCDYKNPFNPIKIYNKSTNFIKPVFNYNNFVDIIAIENLPSLLPFDSSSHFSINLVKLLTNKNYINYWNNNKLLFYNIIKNN